MEFNINFTQDDKETNWFLYCFKVFHKLPNTLIIHDSYIGEELLEELDTTELNTIIEVLPDDGYDYINQKSLHKFTDDIYISFLEIRKKTKEHTITDICFYYKTNDNINEINELIKSIEEYKINFDEDVSKFNTLSINKDRLTLEPLSVFIDDIEVDEKYNTDIIKSIKKLKKKIQKTNKGLSIFFGERGTGKTEMMKSLSIELEKMVLFIPSNTLDLTINNPDFRNILHQHQNLLIVIDDCEFFTNSQFSKMNYLSNNILQLTDSLISDSLNLQFLLIFNEDNIEEIDETLLDCNNLLDIIEFKKLKAEIATDLSKTLGFNKKYKTSQRLVDIFNNRKSDTKNKFGL